MKILNRTAVAAAAVVVLALPQLALAADGGQVKNDFFSISLPAGFGEFAQQAQSASGADGKKVEVTNWVSKAPTGEAVIVTMSKMSGKILDPEKLFASTRDSLLKTVKATLESEEKREGNLPAARLTFKSENAVFRARFVANDDKFYQLLYVGRSDEQRSAPTVSQLFESFQINTAAAPVQAETPAAPAQAAAKTP